MPTDDPEASGRGFTSFAEATRGVLAMLAARVPSSVVFLAHLDEEAGLLRVVDARLGDSTIDLEPGATVPLGQSMCFHMVSKRGVDLSADVPGDPVYGDLASAKGLEVGSYVGAPIVLGDGTLVGTLCAVARRLGAYAEEDLELIKTMARLLAFHLDQVRREGHVEDIGEGLRDQASTDALTGLLNRRALVTALEREWQLTRRGVASSYIVVADVEGLKATNEAHGHGTGDALLKEVALSLSAAARGTDVVGRTSGDEFAVLLVGCEGEREAEGYCGRAAELVERTMSGRSARVRVSLGYRGLADSASAAQALRLAGRAMSARRDERPEG